jgi:hypothetical protein
MKNQEFVAIVTNLALAWTASVAVAGGGDDLPAILIDESVRNANFLPDFSYAGFGNGLVDLPETRGKIISVDDFGAVANDGKDDSEAVLAALAAARDVKGPVVVQFGAGRYQVTEVLKIERSDFVLQGAGSGAGGTTLHFPRPLDWVDQSDSLDELRKYLVDLNKRQKEEDQNLNEYFSEYSWSGGFIWIQKPGTRPAPYLEEYDPPITKLADVRAGTRGERNVTVSDGSAFSAGAVVQVQWINRTGPDAPIIKSLYGGAAESAGSHHWNFPGRPLVRQTSRIESVDGDEIVLADPLLHDGGDAVPAQVAAWEGLQRVGIEELHLEFPMSPWFGHHMELGYNGIYFTSAFDSWVRNVRITNADSGILSYNGANLTFRDITTDGQRKAHYGVHMGNVHNVLAENVTVMNPVVHSLTFNTQSTKCVYKDARVFVAPVLDQHAGANHQNLFDNVTLHTRAADGKIVVFDGSGAGYWQPGHGGFNTTWNLRVLVSGGAAPGEEVSILGLDEGPMARIVGLHGNRRFSLDYRPAPYVEGLNQELRAAPSLYDYQRRKRINQN